MLLSVFAFAELREVEVTWKADSLFDIGNGTIVRVSCGEYECDSDVPGFCNGGYNGRWVDYGARVKGYNGKAYFENDKDNQNLIFDDITCQVVKIFGK